MCVCIYIYIYAHIIYVKTHNKTNNEEREGRPACLAGTAAVNLEGAKSGVDKGQREHKGSFRGYPKKCGAVFSCLLSLAVLVLCVISPDPRAPLYRYIYIYIHTLSLSIYIYIHVYI